MTTARRIVMFATAFTAAGTASSQAAAQVPPSYGHQFVTIGSPGNRNTIPREVPERPYLEIGGVGYEYRMAANEVTASQWLEFVVAYAPYWAGSPGQTAFTSLYIEPTGGGGYGVIPGAEHWPVQVSWESAARYANWLHNGKAAGQWAFENGAYDTSTFTFDPKSGFQHQHAHSPDAKYWLPTWDEWVKATHYDPDRYGPGIEGYWLHPNASEVPLVSGLPGDGGETNAGPAMLIAGIWGMDAGSYPSVAAPWGLLDVSGGWSEWTEDRIVGGLRRVVGSYQRDLLYMVNDRLDEAVGHFLAPDFALQGVRLASSVPGVPTVAVWALVFGCCWTRRTR